MKLKTRFFKISILIVFLLIIAGCRKSEDDNDSLLQNREYSSMIQKYSGKNLSEIEDVFFTQKEIVDFFNKNKNSIFVSELQLNNIIYDENRILGVFSYAKSKNIIFYFPLKQEECDFIMPKNHKERELYSSDNPPNFLVGWKFKELKMCTSVEMIGKKNEDELYVTPSIIPNYKVLGELTDIKKE